MTSPSSALANGTLPATDPEALRRLERFGGQKLLHEMIALFLENAPARLLAASSATSSGDVIAAENALHSLKSSAAQLGALQLSRFCEQGESIARSGSLEGVSEVIQASRAELERVQRWLCQVREGGIA